MKTEVPFSVLELKLLVRSSKRMGLGFKHQREISGADGDTCRDAT